MLINPYLERVAIRDSARFFGRRREISRIFSRLGAARPQSVSLVGERRIGKSSLLNVIMDPAVRGQYLPDHSRYVFIKMDLQERTKITLPEFFREFLLLITAATDFSDVISPDFDGLRKAVSSLERKGRKIIILFDEFDAVTCNPHFGEEFYSFLRSLANNYDLAFITSSRLDLQELCHTSKIADSPFFNIFSTQNLGVFLPEEAAELIALPSGNAGLSLQAYSGDILKLSGYFPFFIQIACSVFFEFFQHGPATPDRQALSDSFMEEVRPHFNYLWEHFTTDEKTVFGSTMRYQPVHPSFQYLSKKLERSGYLQAQGSRLEIFSTAFSSFIEEKNNLLRKDLADTIKTYPPVMTGPVRKDWNFLPGQQLGNFKIDCKLGEGGMGIVLRAQDLQLERQVALKIISPHLMNDSQVQKRFLKEARAASGLNHPNICTIYQVGQEQGLDFIVMEYVDGRTLKDLIQEKKFTGSDMARIGLQLSDALAHAHSRHMIHRDIKPANIMLNADGRIKILDFGLAKSALAHSLHPHGGSGITEEGAVIGTVNYMSPEQLRGEEVDHRTDIFSLGTVFHEMLCGRSPFQRDNYISMMHAILYAEPDPLPPDLPEPLVRIIKKAMVKNPSERFSSVHEIRELLVSFIKSRE